MSLQARERRVLLLLPVAVVLILVMRLGMADRPTAVVGEVDSIPLTERRLAKLRETASLAPGKEELLKRAKAELATREKGVLAADTAAQAQAQLLETIHRVATKAGIDARGAEEMRVRPLSDDYGEVSVAVTFPCRIEQLVNFLADLANQPELLATNELRIASGNPKEKLINVRLSLSGVVPRKLVPEKKGSSTF